MDRMLRQKGTGALYIWTETLALRDDMVEEDENTVATRKKQMQAKLDELQAIRTSGVPSVSKQFIDDAKELADLEAQIKAIEDAARAVTADDTSKLSELDADQKLAQEQRQKRIDEDAEVKKIGEIKKKKEVLEYALLEYGVDLSGDQSIEDLRLDELKEQAKELRVKRIFEV